MRWLFLFAIATECAGGGCSLNPHPLPPEEKAGSPTDNFATGDGGSGADAGKDSSMTGDAGSDAESDAPDTGTCDGGDGGSVD